MRDRPFEVREAFVNGLRREENSAINAPVLELCKNLKPGPSGLEPPEIITVPGTMPAVSFPYPQIFEGEKANRVFTDQTYRIYYDETKNVSDAIVPFLIADAISNAPGAEEITNGNPFAAGGWTFGAPWAIVGGNLVRTAGAGNLDFHRITDTPAVVGDVGRCEIVIDAITAGTLQVCFGSTVVKEFTAGQAGTFVFHGIFAFDGEFHFIADATLVCDIDSVSVMLLDTGVPPAGGGVWEYADFGDVWFASKDTATILNLPFLSAGRPTLMTWATNDLKWFAMCAAQGRLFLGGVHSRDNAHWDTDNWKEMWEFWKKTSPEQTNIYKDLKMDETIVFYSTPHGGDFDYPFLLELAMFGFPWRPDVAADLQTQVLDAISKKEMGFVVLPTKYTVMCLKPLGNYIIAYCYDGVFVLRPTETGGYVQTPIPQLKVGVPSTGAVSGTEARHAFLDRNGDMWSLTASLEVQKLGYKEFFNAAGNSMVDRHDELVATYDPQEDEHYFVISDLGYVLTPAGLGEITILPTGIIRAIDELVGQVVDLADTEILVQLHPINMGYGSEGKTLRAFDVGIQNVTTPTASAYWRNTLGGAWTLSGPFEVSRSGVMFPAVSAKDFKPLIKGTLAAGSKLEWLMIYWQPDGPRGSYHTFERKVV